MGRCRDAPHATHVAPMPGWPPKPAHWPGSRRSLRPGEHVIYGPSAFVNGVAPAAFDIPAGYPTAVMGLILAAAGTELVTLVPGCHFVAACRAGDLGDVETVP